MNGPKTQSSLEANKIIIKNNNKVITLKHLKLK